MTSVALVTDSTCDIPRDLAEARSIALVPLNVSLDGQDYRDGVDITAGEFYARLTGSSRTSTSQPTPALFAETYGRLLQNYDQVVSLHISERLSGTLASAQQAAAEVGEGRVHVVDSQVVSMALGLLCLVASGVIAEDGDAARTIAEVERVRDALRAYFTVGTLEHLRRGGRIGRAQGMLGSVLQIKPVLMLDAGEVAPLEKVRTRERALARVLELVRGVDQGQGLCAIVAHAAAEDTAERIARELDGITDTLMVQPLGPVVGAHAGPGTVGVACYPAELFRLGLKPAATALLQR